MRFYRKGNNLRHRSVIAMHGVFQFASVLIFLVLTACEGAGFAGTWTELKGDSVYVFDSDGTCFLSSGLSPRKNPNKSTCQWWKISDNEISMEFKQNFMTLKANLLPNGNLLVRWPRAGMANQVYSKSQ